MSKQKPFRNKLLQLYKVNYEDWAMFFYVRGVTDALPAVTKAQAIRMFLKKMDISEDDWEFSNARERYYVLQRMYLREVV